MLVWIDKDRFYIYENARREFMSMSEEDFRWILSEYNDKALVLTADTEDFKEYLKINGYGHTRAFNPYTILEKNRGKEDLEIFVDIAEDAGVLTYSRGKYNLNTIAYARDLLDNIAKEEEGLVFVQKDLEITHINEAFYGGRSEEFISYTKAGQDEEIVNFDINSAYVYSLTQRLPDYTTQRVLNKVSLSEISRNKKDYFYIVKAEVKVRDDEFIPTVPVRIKVGEENQTFFPTGRFTTYLTSLDLENLDSVQEFKAIQAYRYSFRDYPILNRVMNELYKLRKESENAEKDFIKAQMVRIYGLLAVRNEGMRRNRLIGTFVTALIRSKLYQMMRELQKYGDILYVDTDSVMLKLKKEDIKKIPVSKELGEIGIRDRYKEIKTFGIKRYVARDTHGEYVIKYSGRPVIYGRYIKSEDKVIVKKYLTKRDEVIDLNKGDRIDKRNNGKPFSYSELEDKYMEGRHRCQDIQGAPGLSN